MTAILSKLLSPAIEIKILEKYIAYKLRIDLSTLSQLRAQCDAKDGKDLNSLLDSWIKKGSNGSSHINIQEMEKGFLKIAKDLGIVIENNISVTKESFDDKTSSYKADITIGADGAHSIFRDVICSEEKPLKQNLDYLMRFEAKVDRGIDYKSWFKKYLAQKRSHYLYSVNQSQDKLTIDFLVDQKTYEALHSIKGCEVNYKNPIMDLGDLHADVVLKEIYNSLYVCLNCLHSGNVKGLHLKEIKITTTSLHTSRNQIFHKIGDGTYDCFLFGDSAFGVPFFRSLNNGLLCAVQLASTIHGRVVDDGKDAADEYCKFVNDLVDGEITKAGVKSKQQDMIISWVRFINKSPLHIIPTRVTGDSRFFTEGALCFP